MPRALRVEYGGAIYHVVNRGDRREDVFLDDVDRERFVVTLAETCEKTGWHAHAFCLMRNHFHLVIETPEPNFSSGMHWLQNAPGGQGTAYQNWQTDSETVFKRLWHQGFKGRFATFKWLALTPASSPPISPYGFRYNESEYRAWKCGRGLAQFINSLPQSYEKNLYSFSQGAIVCGAALTVYQASVQNYVMSQAAAPAGCYDTSTSINSYEFFTSREQTSPTPDATDDLGYRGYLAELNVEGSVVSFFNQVDYALKSGHELGINVSWEGNQIDAKPNQNLSGRTYAYDSGSPNDPFAIGLRCFLRDVGPPFNKRRLTDIHESMSFVARPRSEAAGASDKVAGRITRRYNVGPGSTSALDRASSDHGGQFSRRIQQTWDYYRELGVRSGVLNLQ
jgi:REP element-mobilizing transposase RayT